jgi:class 3 adenylate cyclase
MSANSEQRKLAAIMFTDMVGYSAVSQRDDKLALELLDEHFSTKEPFRLSASRWG